MKKWWRRKPVMVPPLRPDEPEMWYDEIISQDDTWFVVRVVTPAGKSVIYRLMVGPARAS